MGGKPRLSRSTRSKRLECLISLSSLSLKNLLKDKIIGENLKTKNPKQINKAEFFLFWVKECYTSQIESYWGKQIANLTYILCGDEFVWIYVGHRGKSGLTPPFEECAPEHAHLQLTPHVSLSLTSWLSEAESMKWDVTGQLEMFKTSSGVCLLAQS